MALTREKKEQIISDISQLLSDSKLTVMAIYQGTTVKAMQELRKQANENGTQLRVVKNRLVKKALEGNDQFKDIDNSVLTGQMLYAFNSQDEVAPAQTLANFAKTNPTIEFVAAITAEGNLISADEVKHLASLPTKDQLRGQLVGIIGSPLSGLASVLSGNGRGLLAVLNAHAKTIN